MIWKKIVLAASCIMAVILSLIAFTHNNEVREYVDVHLTHSQDLPFDHPYPINGMSLSGSWKGNGYAQAWLLADDKQYLILDTGKATTSSFREACAESCRTQPVNPKRIHIEIFGDGELFIDEYQLNTASDALGLALCPTCKKVTQEQAPDHSLFLLVLLLLLAIIGAHVMSHCCSKPLVKLAITAIYIVSFLLLTTVFGVSVAAPTTQIAQVAKETASIFSALGVIILFALTAVELGLLDGWTNTHPIDPEDEWEKKH